LTLVEGEAHVDIEIQSNFPPQFFYLVSTDQSYSIQIEIEIQQTDNEYLCTDGKTVTQAVIGWADLANENRAFCGVELADDNWNEKLTVPVLAALDGIVDDDVSASITVWKRDYVGGNRISSVQIANIYANIVNRDRDAYCTSYNDPHIMTFDGM